MDLDTCTFSKPWFGLTSNAHPPYERVKKLLQDTSERANQEV